MAIGNALSVASLLITLGGIVVVPRDSGLENQLAMSKQAFQDMLSAGADVEKGIAPDLRYHHIILQASGNQMLIPLGHTIESALAASFRISSSVPNERAASLARHESVLNAIAAHDGDLAEETMRNLIDMSQELILKMID